MRIFSAAVVLLFLSVFVSTTAPPDTLGQERVLLPATSTFISDAFSALEPEWVLKSGAVLPKRADVVICRAANGDCVELVLSDPKGSCDGELMDSWCVTAPNGFGSLPLDRLHKALTNTSEGQIWNELSEDESQDSRREELPWPSPWMAWIWAFATLLGPGLLFWGFGWGVSRATHLKLRSPAWFLLALLLPVLWVFIIPPFWLGVGTADWFTLALSGVVGLLMATHAIPRGMGRNAWLSSIVGVVLVLLLMEVIAGLLTAPQFSFPNAEDIPWRRDRSELLPPDAERSSLLYPTRFPDAVRERFTGKEPNQKLVFHVGDSMVQGVGLPLERAFPKVLDRLQPDTVHVNLGMNGTGTDYQVQLVLNWLKISRPDKVVLYVFPGNDICDMNIRYPFCGNDSILETDGDSVKLRCPEPIWCSDIVAKLYASNPPFFLSVLASVSSLGKHLCSAYWNANHWMFSEPSGNGMGSLRTFTSALRILRDRLEQERIPLVVVVLPYRTIIEGKVSSIDLLPEEADPTAMGHLLDQLDLHWLDAWSFFAPLVKEHGAATYFLDEPKGDVHFNVEGHQVLADWLNEILPLRSG